MKKAMSSIIKEKRKSKIGLLILSLCIGLAANLTYFYYDHFVISQWALENVVIFTEVLALTYILVMMIAFVNTFFRSHRNITILFLNIFFLLVTIGIFLTRGEIWSW